MADDENVGGRQFLAVPRDQRIATAYRLEALRVQVVMRDLDAKLSQRLLGPFRHRVAEAPGARVPHDRQCEHQFSSAMRRPRAQLTVPSELAAS